MTTTGSMDITEAMVEAGAEALGWNPLIWSAAKTHANAVIKAALAAAPEPDGLDEEFDLTVSGTISELVEEERLAAIIRHEDRLDAHDAALAEMREENRAKMEYINNVSARVEVLEDTPPAVTADKETCYRCHGKGRSMLGDTCTRCDGRGFEPPAVPPLVVTPQLWHEACDAFDDNTSHVHQGVRLALEIAAAYWNAIANATEDE